MKNRKRIESMEPPPEILYKYRSLSGDAFKFTHDIFIKNELYFPHPDQINDPFDCKLHPYLKDLTKEQIIKYFNALDPKPKGLDLNKLKEHPSSYIEEHFKANPPKAQQNVGVLSFSEKYSDILMWGHYADSHKGICIGFDYHGLFFTFKGPVPPEQVKYPNDNEYPKWNPFVDDVISQIDKMYFTKARPWHYEKEWRVILPEHGKSLQKIDPNAIVSVYLGCQIEPGDRETVINWCLQREQKPKMYEMIKDDTSYTLKENEVLY
jgi:hypothetical protein